MKDKIDKVTGEILFELPTFKNAYGDHSPASVACGLRCSDESLASQSAKDEADINVLVRRFGLDGEIPTDVRAPSYGDFTNLGSYQEALNALLGAQNAFMEMPAAIRAEFDNDPHRFVAFCSDDANYDRMCDLGLLAPEPMQKRVDARLAAAAAELEAKVSAELAKREKAVKPA
ncbi:MAG: internal scaffolding protein [Microvirus sp.]|nr:MAG: internal scaffolding protein [Microvirus sp.]